MNQIILTGASGFIGAWFSYYLSQRGVDVIALGRKPLASLSNRQKEKLTGSNYFELPMDKINNLRNLILERNIPLSEDLLFFNLAWGGFDRLSDLNIEAQIRNVSWSVSALESAKSVGCKRFIQVGTMEEAFTKTYLDLDYKKSTYYNRHLIYSAAKIAAKRAVKVRARQIGVEINYVLHSHVMGPDDNKDSVLQETLKKIAQGDDLVFSSGEQLFDVISVDDCCLGYHLICERGVPGSEYWVGSGDPRCLRNYIERMYNLYPSTKPLEFGKLSYNDVHLCEDVFSIEALSADTGFKPQRSYEEAVHILYKSLFEN